MPDTPAEAASAAFTMPLRVRYHETDPQRFVFNSRYLEYADVALTEYFRWLGWDYPSLIDAGCDPSLVQTQVQFVQPARLDDLLQVTATCTRVGTSSFDLTFEVSRGAEQLCVIRSTYVNVSLETGRPVKIPTMVASALASRINEG